jgi:hypothetical protein
MTQANLQLKKQRPLRSWLPGRNICNPLTNNLPCSTRICMSQWPYFTCFPTPITYQIPFSRVGRMEAKGCAKPAVWKEARRLFYWALRRKVAQLNHIKTIQEASPTISRSDAKDLLFSLLPATLDPKNNHAMTQALEKLNIESTLSELREAEIARQITAFIRSPNRKAALNGLLSAAQSLTDDERALFRSAVTSVDHSPSMFSLVSF